MLPAPETALAGTKKQAASSRKSRTKKHIWERRGEEKREKRGRATTDGGTARDLERITRPIETRKRRGKRKSTDDLKASEQARKKRQGRIIDALRTEIYIYIYSRSFQSPSLCTSTVLYFAVFP